MIHLLALIAAAVALPVAVHAADAFDHSDWDQLLQVRVSVIGEVDYAALAADPGRLNAYVGRLGEASPENRPELFPSREHELAYWINAYNALAIRGALDHYPLESVRKARRFFEAESFLVGGRRASLDYIEHEVLRPRYREPRIHFAIVCASVSCPTLARSAFTAEQLEAQLSERARAFVNHPRNVEVDTARRTATLSRIFDWFRADFEATAGGKGDRAVLAFILRWADPETRRALESISNLKIKHFEYDWGLNEPGSRARSPNLHERALAGSGS